MGINPIMKLLWGKAEFKHASSCFYFRKKSRVQKLIHALKYKGNTEVGVELGKLMANELQKSPAYESIDLILPVPLHPSKKLLRGYNQCDFIAEGLAQEFGVEVNYGAIIRTQATETQTKKGHFERHQNVSSIFKVNDKEGLQSKNILLIDDVITTGSTLASCAQQVFLETNNKPLISTVALAS